jgi:hypothetical protein
MNYEPTCYTHGGPRVDVEGEEGCQDAYCVELRNDPPSSEPLFNLSWLKQSNLAGQTAFEFKQEIYENARREGRDIERAR